MELAILVLVAVTTLLITWSFIGTRMGRGRAGFPADPAGSELQPGPRTRSLRVPRAERPVDRSLIGTLSDEAGSTSISLAPSTTDVRVLGTLSHASSQVLVAGPALRQLNSGQLYEMVHRPAGEFMKRADGSFLGTARRNNRISGNATWKEVSTRSAKAASAMGTLATIAAGAYWQQQVDQKLGRLQQGVDAIASRLTTTLQAELVLAHDIVSLDEVTEMDGPYRASGAVTDGLRAARVDLMELQQHFADRADSEDAMAHTDYVERILTTAHGEHVGSKLHRAAAGLVLEMRVLRLKWAHSYGQPPAYLETLHQELDDALTRCDQLIAIGRRLREIESAHPAAWKSFWRSRRRLRRAATDAQQGRRDIGEAIGVLSGRLEEVRQLQAPQGEGVIRFFVGHDGQRMLVMAEALSDPEGDLSHLRG